MPRIRTVKPEFWEDEKVACLSRDARLMYIGCFNLADDEGLLRWSPAYLKSALFMYDDDLDTTDVKGLMDEIVEQSAILPYSPAVARGSVKQNLAWIVKFRIHQKINRPQPSKLSPPSPQNRAVQAAYAARDNWTCHLCGGPVNETTVFPPSDPYSPPTGYVSGRECLNASLDHIIPRAAGGGDHPTNIALAHIGCNKGRRERSVESFSLPLSVRSALEAIGWLTEHAVNDSVNNSVNDSLPEGEGEREEEQEREGDAPPPRFCPKHPNGTDTGCWACKTYREAFQAWESQAEQVAIERRQQRESERLNCPDCHGTSQIEIDDAGTVRKCNHQAVSHA